jgi:hypothetical protein
VQPWHGAQLRPYSSFLKTYLPLQPLRDRRPYTGTVELTCANVISMTL